MTPNFKKTTELEKRVKRAQEITKSLPSWAKHSAVFMGGENLRKGLDK
jgi:hypothetical protein